MTSEFFSGLTGGLGDAAKQIRFSGNVGEIRERN